MASKVDEDIKILTEFIQIYCDNKHRERPKINDNGTNICAECQNTLSYSSKMREYCSLDPKPICKKCTIHCYKPEYRQRIKEIMRHSGMSLIMRGRIDLIFHYFF